MIECGQVIDPRSEKLLEYADARASRFEAQLEYVAMMSDVDLMEEEEGDDELRS
jgi:hypothetical protein